MVLRVGDRQATFLPQVWEQLPDKEQFLDHSPKKAGLEPRPGRATGGQVLVYQVEA